MMKVDGVTWAEAEEALLAAVEYLGLLPDAEVGFLSAGSRSCWPQIVRSAKDGDYGEGQGHCAALAPSPALTRRRLALVHAMLLDDKACAMAVPEGHRRLVGRVLIMQLRPGPAGFRWERVWMAEGGRACGVTSDALRRRYDRAVGKVAAVMDLRGVRIAAEARAASAD